MVTIRMTRDMATFLDGDLECGVPLMGTERYYATRLRIRVPRWLAFMFLPPEIRAVCRTVKD